MATSSEDDTTTDARLAPWSARWAASRIAFHIDEVHPVLRRHGARLGLDESTTPPRVLVPLCGKTVDLAYLADTKKCAVVGVDGVRQALDEFVADHGATLTPTADTPGSTYKVGLPSGASLEYVVGDFFAYGAETKAAFDAAFDRGGLVAVDPQDRDAYVAVLSRLATTVLLVAVEHAPFDGGKLGPPFSLERDAVEALAATHGFAVTALEREDRMLVEGDVWRARGVEAFVEATYLLVRKEETASSSSS